MKKNPKIASTISIKELIKECLNNNRIAQKSLYDKYCDAMYTLAYRMTNDEMLAQDVLQEAFINVFKYLGSFKGDSTIGAWIKKIVVREAWKKVKKREIYDEIDEVNQNEIIIWPVNLEIDYLEQAIMTLDDKYRTVFTLIEVEGYSHREVADMLNMTEGTSKSQLSRAKKKLRDILGEITR